MIAKSSAGDCCCFVVITAASAVADAVAWNCVHEEGELGPNEPIDDLQPEESLRWLYNWMRF